MSISKRILAYILVLILLVAITSCTLDRAYFDAPTVPGNPNPINGATDVSTNVTLSWQCVDPEGRNLVYDVYFGTDSSPGFKVETTNNVYDPGALANGTTYYWKIAASNGKKSTTGPIWRFTTVASN